MHVNFASKRIWKKREDETPRLARESYRRRVEAGDGCGRRRHRRRRRRRSRRRRRRRRRNYGGRRLRSSAAAADYAAAATAAAAVDDAGGALEQPRGQLSVLDVLHPALEALQVSHLQSVVDGALLCE